MAIDIEIDEMKRQVKTEGDALNMALKAVASKTKGEYFTVAELLKEDNLIRKAYGLSETKGYPVMSFGYSPATGASDYRRILGGRVVKKSGQLPYGELITEEVENFDPAKRMGEIMPLVDAKIDADFPAMNLTHEERKPIVKMVRLSVVKKMQIEAGSDANTSLPDYAIEEKEEEPIKKSKKSV